MKMFSEKKRYLKVVSLLLVCCMIAGIIGVQPMVAEAAVDANSFATYNNGYSGSTQVVSWSDSGAGVQVQQLTNDDWITLTTANSYNAKTGIHLEVTDIVNPTADSSGYSFVMFMGKHNGSVDGVNYADTSIAMAFSSDGRYKVWKTTNVKGEEGANANPAKTSDLILVADAFEKALGNSLSIDIKVEKGYYNVTVNGMKVSFPNTEYVDSTTLKLGLQVWKSFSDNYQTYGDIEGASFVITDLSHIDPSTEGKGFVDDYNNYITYKTEEPLSAFPLTFEAEVYWTGTDDNSRNTTLAGTWDFGGKRSYDVRMLSDGTVFLTVRKGTSQFGDIILYGAKVTQNEWTHLAIVVNPEVDATTGQYYVNTYINGVLKSTVGFGFNQKLNDTKDAWIAGTPVDPTTLKPSLPLVIGANNVAADPMLAEGETPATTTLYAAHRGTCFDGRIKSVSLWNEARTKEEVLADCTNGVTVSDKTLLGHYELEEGKTTFEDKSGNGNDVVARKSWIKDLSEIGKTELVKGEDYEYSMVVVGDTQIINDYKNGSIDTTNYDNSKLATIYKWIAKNKDALNLQFVMGLGDITDYNHQTEWANADYSLTNYLLNNNIRFASTIGNHDYSAGYNSMSYLTTDKYQGYIEGNYWKDKKSMDGYMEDSYQLLEVETTEGTLKYLLMTLGYGPDDNVLQWAGEVCEQYPDYNVIVATHAYLQYDKSTLDSENDATSTIPSLDGAVSYYPYEESRNDGDDIWNEFVRKHENITMVLSGHVSSQEVIWSSQTGDNGNKVTELLIDPQGIDASGDNGLLSTGMVSILYFDAEGNAVAHRNYSTIQEMYYSDLSQFDNLGINVIKPVELSGVEISKDNLLMIPGETETLRATLVPATVSGTVTWSSDNTEVATVDEATGLVTAGVVGEAIITATCGDYKAKCKVWVCEKTDLNLWSAQDVLPISNNSTHNIQEYIAGYKVNYKAGATDSNRMNYTKNLYISSTAGVRIKIENIKTETETYSIGVWFGDSLTGWNTVNGYMLLCKNNGEFVIVDSQATTGISGSSVLAQGNIGERSDSLSISFLYDTDGTTLLVEVNGVTCSFVPTKTIGRFAVGAMGDFSVNSETTTLNYTSLNLTKSPLSYCITYLNWKGNIEGSVSVKDYTNVFDYYRVSGESPVKGGYVFAGWYEDAGATKPVSTSVKKAEAGKTYYAKFLPEDVLSVKAQLKLADGVEPTDASGKTQMRLITTVDDTLNFAEVGFVVTSGTTSKTYPRYTAYSSLSAAGVEMTPSVFNACSKRFATVNIGDVTWNENTKPKDRPITVQAYWKTCDGTIVYGTARTLTIQQGLEAFAASTQPYGL